MIEVQHENLELFVVVAWYIWLLRNKNRVNEPCTPVGKIYEAAQNTLSEFQSKATPKQPKAIPNKVKWRPPISDFYKANYDGALLEELGEAGLGFVIRNEKGEVMGSLAEKINKPDSVEVLEALATRRAVLFAVELGLQRVVFEGDSETVFKALSGATSDRSCIGNIIKDCKSTSGDAISSMACTFSRFASIPLWDTMNPKNFPDATPKAHLLGFNFI
ncbi:uncharacterized protein LOC111998512 [Quercus suber]|uniref:uncharacterized protein LOC111998512 n=1 Tax=Quercus suber TaxID=58331 RepID=UPI000CE269D7|nr:uncharacterized protein LOC111998512 [Quercus suber]